MVAFGQAEPRVERQRLKGTLAAVLHSGYSGDVVVGKGRRRRDAEVAECGVFEFKCRRRVVEGAAAPSRTNGGVDLQLLFACGTDVASLDDAEQVFGIH